MTRMRDEQWTYYEALRAKWKIELLSSHLVMTIIGFIVGVFLVQFDSAWPAFFTMTVLVATTIVLITSATGIAYRIQRGDFDE